MTWRVQYKPVPTMGWHPGALKPASLDAAQRYADHLGTIHPRVRVVGKGNVVVYIPTCRPLSQETDERTDGGDGAGEEAMALAADECLTRCGF